MSHPTEEKQQKMVRMTNQIKLQWKKQQAHFNGNGMRYVPVDLLEMTAFQGSAHNQ